MKNSFRFVSLLGLFLLTAGCSPQGVSSAPAPSPGVQETATPAVQERTESQKKAEALAEQGKEVFFDTSLGGKRHIQAIDLCNQAIVLDPGCYQAYNIKGIAMAFQGNLSGALQNIDKAIALRPDFAYAYFNRGLALAYHHQLEESLVAYEKAVQLDPRDPWTYFGMASMHAQLQRPEKALENLRKAIDLDPYCKVTAREERDKDFKYIRHLPEYQDLVKE